MRGQKNCALQVPPVAPCKTLGNFPKALYGTTRGTSSAQFFHPVMAEFYSNCPYSCYEPLRGAWIYDRAWGVRLASKTNGEFSQPRPQDLSPQGTVR